MILNPHNVSLLTNNVRKKNASQIHLSEEIKIFFIEQLNNLKKFRKYLFVRKFRNLNAWNLLLIKNQRQIK